MTDTWHNSTTLHPLGLLAVLVLGGAILILPRRWAVLPMLIMACFVAPAQRLVVAGLDFNLLRIMVIFGWVRVLALGEYRDFRWRPIDFAIVLWAIAGTITYTMLRGSTGALIYKLGWSYDAIGMYFFFRFVVRDFEDLTRVAKGLAIIAVFVAFVFVVEKMTGRNMFAIFGGVPEQTAIRQGRMRCQGAFAHPILAGTFWAVSIGLIGALYRDQRSRSLAIVGIVASVAIVILSTSSTPMIALVLCAFGAFMFKYRHHLGAIRLSVVGVLVLLHIVMNKPVWHLIARIDLVGGSTGWHRYHLIDQAINRVGEWAVMGTYSTAHWGYGLADVTNQYVLEGVRGGLITLSLFVVTIVLAFGEVGRAWRRVEGDRIRRALTWAVGVSLFTHCMAFIAVSYFGQITMLWYLSLALAACVGAITERQRRIIPTGAIARRQSVPMTGRPALS
ncbi:MAG: hypothetical protein ACF8PN_07930 [Phycisphaerales bacterium]